ncbi:unnamed protein product [Pleuronectes platessa]|uniref:Uncharacterized protein n=1 Tax=Pleuronectes platessa TaxID=8262 RepID=A0A9N7YXM3_PLEPL|nr:unnamed protein product [Pleuronectes platessa]
MFSLNPHERPPAASWAARPHKELEERVTARQPPLTSLLCAKRQISRRRIPRREQRLRALDPSLPPPRCSRRASSCLRSRLHDFEERENNRGPDPLIGASTPVQRSLMRFCEVITAVEQEIDVHYPEGRGFDPRLLQSAFPRVPWTRH